MVHQCQATRHAGTALCRHCRHACVVPWPPPARRTSIRRPPMHKRPAPDWRRRARLTRKALPGKAHAPAAIAQLGERQTEDLKVPSSILGLGICPAYVPCTTCTLKYYMVASMPCSPLCGALHCACTVATHVCCHGSHRHNPRLYAGFQCTSGRR